MAEKLKRRIKTPLSWLLAFIVAFIFVRMFIKMLVGHFDNSMLGALIIPVFIFAIPIYIIIKKNIFN